MRSTAEVILREIEDPEPQLPLQHRTARLGRDMLGGVPSSVHGIGAAGPEVLCLALGRSCGTVSHEATLLCLRMNSSCPKEKFGDGDTVECLCNFKAGRISFRMYSMYSLERSG